MKAFTATDRVQFRTLLHFLDDVSVDVTGRLADENQAAPDDRLKALAQGKLSLEERDCLIEKLAGNPELLRRLAIYLRDQFTRDNGGQE
jgi:hypothetical protein